MTTRRTCLLAALAWPLAARAHHGWSDFDQSRPLFLQGCVVSLQWHDPHVEMVLELPPDYRLPADLASREVPSQTAPVDGPALLARARAPRRKDRRWEIELAPVTRMEAWKVAPMKVGTTVGVLGYAAPGEEGEAVLRAEFLYLDGKVYGLRSSPA